MLTIRLALYILNIVNPTLGSSHKQCVRAMHGSRSWQCSSHKDALCIVDLLSSEDVAVVVDLQIATWGC